MTIYLASPLGFAESTLCFLDLLRQRLTGLGLEIFDPWSQGYDRLLEEAQRHDNGSGAHSNLHRANHAISKKNEDAIRDCDRVIAVLDGVDVDSGTASEVGFAYGLGRQIDGLRTDFRLSGDNVATVVNIQVQYWIEASGGRIYQSLDQLCQGLGTKPLATAATAVRKR
jgi:nucleoside 2-deoxyribosyltransferase